MRVLYACTELFPLLKTGGLGDVSGALPPALREAGCDVRVLLPGFPTIRDGVGPSELAHGAPIPLPAGSGPDLASQGLAARPPLIQGTLPGTGLAAYVLDVPAFFDRPGNPYHDGRGDNAVRFALLGWAAACLGHGLDPHWQPDIVHCNDWHTGLAPLYLRQMAMPGPPPAATVFTVHNLAYQGLFPPSVFPRLGLPDYLFGIHGVEFWGQVSFMKAGLQFADRITTVSPTYAREILDARAAAAAWTACCAPALSWCRGILNGIDDDVWSPASDPACSPIPTTATRSDRKAPAKAALQRRLGLDERPDALLFGVVSRLTEQKGLDLVAGVAAELAGRRRRSSRCSARGEPALEQAFRARPAAHRRPVAVHIGYDEALAHRIVAGADVILVPSRFEPCGLTQLYGAALRHAAGRAPGRRPRRHRRGCRAPEPGNRTGHRHPVRRVQHAGPARGTAAGVRPEGAAAGMAANPADRHAAALRLARARRAVRRAVPFAPAPWGALIASKSPP